MHRQSCASLLLVCASVLTTAACTSIGPVTSGGACDPDGAHKVYDPNGSELLVSLGENMLKVREHGGTDRTMFDDDWRIGDQVFTSRVSAVAFVGGTTLLGFRDGRFLKIRGTGGTGHNMFAVERTGDGFRSVPGYDHYVGSHRFRSEVTGIYPAGSVTFVSFADRKLLKVRGSGGSGQNLFAIRETASSFSGLPGYDYYLGDQRFDSDVVDVSHAHGVTLISLQDGKVLKVRGTGGTGHNMFAVTERGDHFESVAGFDYYLGDQRFGRPASAVLITDTETLIAFTDGRILKVRGTGGTGRRMFNVTEASYGFRTYDGRFTDHLVGSQHLEHRILLLQPAGDELFVSVSGRGLLKIAGTGGTGGNMFNIDWTNGAYQRSSGSSAEYLRGQERSRGNVVTLSWISGLTFFVNEECEAFKVTGTGGLGREMFGAYELWCSPTTSVVGCCGYGSASCP